MRTTPACVCVYIIDNRTADFQLRSLPKIVLQIPFCLKRARLPKVTGLFFAVINILWNPNKRLIYFLIKSI